MNAGLGIVPIGRVARTRGEWKSRALEVTGRPVGRVDDPLSCRTRGSRTAVTWRYARLRLEAEGVGCRGGPTVPWAREVSKANGSAEGRRGSGSAGDSRTASSPAATGELQPPPRSQFTAGAEGRFARLQPVGSDAPGGSVEVSRPRWRSADFVSDDVTVRRTVFLTGAASPRVCRSKWSGRVAVFGAGALMDALRAIRWLGAIGQRLSVILSGGICCV